MIDLIKVEKIIPRRNQVSLLLVGATFVVWGILLLGFVFLYKGVF